MNPKKNLARKKRNLTEFRPRSSKEHVQHKNVKKNCITQKVGEINAVNQKSSNDYMKKNIKKKR